MSLEINLSSLVSHIKRAMLKLQNLASRESRFSPVSMFLAPSSSNPPSPSFVMNMEKEFHRPVRVGHSVAVPPFASFAKNKEDTIHNISNYFAPTVKTRSSCQRFLKECFRYLSPTHLVADCMQKVHCKRCYRYGHLQFSCRVPRPKSYQPKPQSDPNIHTQTPSATPAFKDSSSVPGTPPPAATLSSPRRKTPLLKKTPILPRLRLLHN